MGAPVTVFGLIMLGLFIAMCLPAFIRDVMDWYYNRSGR